MVTLTVFLFAGCAHVSEYGFIDQKLKALAIEKSIMFGDDFKANITYKKLKNQNVALVVNGMVAAEQSDYVKAVISKLLLENNVNICSLEKADYLLDISVDVLGTVQDDEHFGFLYHTSKRIGQTRINLTLIDAKSKKALNADALKGSAMWTELYIFWIFGPIRKYIDDIDYKEY